MMALNFKKFLNISSKAETLKEFKSMVLVTIKHEDVHIVAFHDQSLYVKIDDQEAIAGKISDPLIKDYLKDRVYDLFIYAFLNTPVGPDSMSTEFLIAIEKEGVYTTKALFKFVETYSHGVKKKARDGEDFRIIFEDDSYVLFEYKNNTLAITGGK